MSPLKFRSSTRFVIFDRGKFLLHCVKLDLCIRYYLKQCIRLRYYYYSAAQRNIFIPNVIFVILHLNNTVDIMSYTHLDWNINTEGVCVKYSEPVPMQ